MSKAVLMSIQPKWVEKIASGEKTIEVRKTRPKLETPFKVYIYCTKHRKDMFWLNEEIKDIDGLPKGLRAYNSRLGNCSIIGEFVCDKITDISVVVRNCNEDYNHVYHNDECKGSCLTWKELQEYGKGKPLYGWHISDLKIYDKPKELSEFKKENRCYKKGDLDNIGCWERGCVRQEFGECDGRCSVIERPPQSWCYVEEVQE